MLSALAPYSVTVFDPVVAPDAKWHPKLQRADSALAACDGADALIVMTPWPEFKQLKPTEIATRLKGKIVIDPFACLDHVACESAGLKHLTLGKAS